MVMKIFMIAPLITLIELSDRGWSEFFIAGERAKSIISTRRAQNENISKSNIKRLGSLAEKLKIVTGLKIDTRCQVKS